MKSETRLHSAVFQLTPTRTRFDLVIVVDGKTEKIASGLLNPFLAHLKTARDQIAKGGYSITLQPDISNQPTWFTKGTMESFMRFVNTPGLLERVSTIESEMIQIDEAIALQSNENVTWSTVGDRQTKTTDSSEASKPVLDADSEKAIVLYETGMPPPQPNGSLTQERSSKVQLLRGLETRRTVLKNEQGMAFARAVAAGFDMDHLALLVLFAESFGASRMKEASVRFMELWKQKHETGQWIEIEAAEALSMQSDFSFLQDPGVLLRGDSGKKKEFSDERSGSNGQSESNDKASAGEVSDMNQRGDIQPPLDSQTPYGSYKHFQGQFQPPTYSHWPIHTPPAGPLFQQYLQGLPYYQGYSGSSPFLQPAYPLMEDPILNPARKARKYGHSIDSKKNNDTSDGHVNESVIESEKGLQDQESSRKVGRCAKKKTGKVVIGSVTYIGSKMHQTSGVDSKSASETGSDDEADIVKTDGPDTKYKSLVKSSKSNGVHVQLADERKAKDVDGFRHRWGTDNGNWQGFQNYLLRHDEDKSIVDADFFSNEKKIYFKRRQRTEGADPLLSHERDSIAVSDKKMLELVGGKGLLCGAKISNDDQIVSCERFHLDDSPLDVQFAAMESRGGNYRSTSNDDFTIFGQRSHLVDVKSSDSLAENEYSHTTNRAKTPAHTVIDESFLVPYRYSLPDQCGTDSRLVIDMDTDLSSTMQISEDSSSKLRDQLFFEPDDLMLLPERGAEMESTGYDPAVDYESAIIAKDRNVQSVGDSEDVGSQPQEDPKKLDKEKTGSLERRKLGSTIRSRKHSGSNPLLEAQLLAERLRSYKADLQKMKKEKEEEEIRRLEALKKERQKRIAARSSQGPAQFPSSSGPGRNILPTKISPGSSHSKFTYLGPGSGLPVSKVAFRTSAACSSGSQEISRATRLSSSHKVGSGLSRSTSSLSELKKENHNNRADPEEAALTIRRSDSKGSNILSISSPRSAKCDHCPKPNLTHGPGIKKIFFTKNLDKLPELRINTSRSSADVVHSKPVAKKEVAKKGSGNSEPPKDSGNDPDHSHCDDNSVIEKTVVLLEHEKTSAPGEDVSQNGMALGNTISDEKEKTKVLAECAALRAPPSPTIEGEANQPSQLLLDLQSNPHEIESYFGLAIRSQRELLKSSTVGAAEIIPCQPPCVQASSLEDKCTSNAECDEAPVISSQANMTETRKVQMLVSSVTFLPEHNLEALEKPRGRVLQGFQKHPEIWKEDSWL